MKTVRSGSYGNCLCVGATSKVQGKWCGSKQNFWEPESQGFSRRGRAGTCHTPEEEAACNWPETGSGGDLATPRSYSPHRSGVCEVCLCWGSGGRTPRPKVRITSETTHSPFPLGSSGEVREFKYLGLGLPEGKEKQKEIERRGAEAQGQIYTPR